MAQKELIIISTDLVFQLINVGIMFIVLKKLLFKPVLGIIEA